MTKDNSVTRAAVEPHAAPESLGVEAGGGTAQETERDEQRRHHRIRLAAGVVLVAAVLVAVAVTSSDRTTSGSSTEKGTGLARSFELPDVRQDEPVVSLASFRGKPVVLNFWASWCAPCRKEMPAFQAVAERVNRQVAFVGLNHQDSRRLALELLAETGVAYPSGYDPGGKVAAAYGLLGMPTTVFISAEGKIMERRTGEMSRQDLEHTLERLFRA